MGKRTILSGENLTTGTGLALAAFQTAAAGANNAQLVRMRRIEISQRGTTTLEAIRGDVALRTIAGTFTMTAATPQPHQPVGGAASGITGNTALGTGTARSGVASSADSGGTYTTIFPFSFFNTVGYLWKPDDGEELWVMPSQMLVVRFLAAPTGTTGWCVSLWLDEN